MAERDYENFVPSTEAERIAVAAAKLAVNNALADLLAKLGINSANFEDMERLRKDIHFLKNLRQYKDIWKDLEFISSARSSSRWAGSRFALALITLIAGGVAWGFWSWIKFMISSLPPVHR